MTNGKIIALTRHTFFGKVISLLFNMLYRLVIAFLLRSKCLLISWLQSPFAVILKPKKIKSDTVSIVSPSISHEVMGLDAIKSKDDCSFEESYDQPRQHIKKQRHYFAIQGPSSQSYGFSSSHVWM